MPPPITALLPGRPASAASLPAASPAAASSAADARPAPRPGVRTYVVERGDTIHRLYRRDAARAGEAPTPAAEAGYRSTLLTRNPRPGGRGPEDFLFTGERLDLPPSGADPRRYVVERGDTASHLYARDAAALGRRPDAAERGAYVRTLASANPRPGGRGPDTLLFTGEVLQLPALPGAPAPPAPREAPAARPGGSSSEPFTSADAARAYLARAARDPALADPRLMNLALGLRREPGMTAAQARAAYAAIAAYGNEDFTRDEVKQGAQGLMSGASPAAKYPKETMKEMGTVGGAANGIITIVNGAWFRTPQAFQQLRDAWQDPSATRWAKVSAVCTTAAAVSGIPRGAADLTKAIVKVSKRVKSMLQRLPRVEKTLKWASPATYAVIYAADIAATGAKAAEKAQKGELTDRDKLTLSARALASLLSGLVQTWHLGLSPKHRGLKAAGQDAKLHFLVEDAKRLKLDYDYGALASNPKLRRFQDVYERLKDDPRLTESMKGAKAAKLDVHTSHWSRAFTWLAAIDAAFNAVKGVAASGDPRSSPETARSFARNAWGSLVDAGTYTLKDPRAILGYMVANVVAASTLPNGAIARYAYARAGLPGAEPGPIRLPDGTTTMASDPWGDINGRFGTQSFGQLLGLGVQRISERVRGDTRARQVREIYQEAADDAQATAIALELLTRERRTGEATDDFRLARATVNAGDTTVDRKIEAITSWPRGLTQGPFLPISGLTAIGLAIRGTALVEFGKSASDLAMERRVEAELAELRTDLAGATPEQVEAIAQLNPRQRAVGTSLVRGAWGGTRRLAARMAGRKG